VSHVRRLFVCIAVVLATGATGAATAQDAAREEIREALRKKFVHASPEELDGYVRRLEQGLNRLPPDPAVRSQAVTQIGSWAAIAVVHLEGMDQYRSLAEAHPEARLLSLPTDYYRRAHATAVEAIESEFSRAVEVGPTAPAALEGITRQIEKLGADAEASAGGRLQGEGARALWAESIGGIMKEFKAIAGNRFFGFSRPLNDAEYGGVLAELQGKLQALPIIRLDEKAKAPDDDEKDPVGVSNSQVVVNDAAKAKRLLGEAAEILYQYSRLQNPSQHEINDRLDAVSDQAFAWMKEAKAQHPKEFAAMNARLREKLAPPRAETAERKADPRAAALKASKGPSAAPADDASKAPSSRPAPASGEDPSSRRWIAFAILACGAVVALVLVLRRKGA
jgi:hypothetical protein